MFFSSYSTNDKKTLKENELINDVKSAPKNSEKKENSNETIVPIYSRKGDFGKTEINGILLSKSDKIFHAIGATDELSSLLGFVFNIIIA